MKIELTLKEMHDLIVYGDAVLVEGVAGVAVVKIRIGSDAGLAGLWSLDLDVWRKNRLVPVLHPEAERLKHQNKYHPVFNMERWLANTFAPVTEGYYEFVSRQLFKEEQQ